MTNRAQKGDEHHLLIVCHPLIVTRYLAEKNSTILDKWLSLPAPFFI